MNIAAFVHALDLSFLWEKEWRKEMESPKRRKKNPFLVSLVWDCIERHAGQRYLARGGFAWGEAESQAFRRCRAQLVNGI